ncbi:hypothetical protein RQP46_006207 [Phenoliferia psychrophenolica]
MSASPITLPYAALLSPTLETKLLLTSAFSTSPTSQGLLLISDLPPSLNFPQLRARLLAFSNAFASLPEHVREEYADAKSRYSFGWSCGKEIMNGKPDTYKGSFYNNVAAAQDGVDAIDDPRNIWPEGEGIEGFRDAFLQLCKVIVMVGGLVARACDKVVEDAGGMASDKTVEELIKTSQNSKARLLHYFPPAGQTFTLAPSSSELPPGSVDDSWCGVHFDHSILTGLCPAMYLFHPSPPTSPSGATLAPLIIPSPSAAAGLYIKTRAGETIKAPIPETCIAFQTGETLQLLSSDRLAATPHFVNAAPDALTLSSAAAEVVERKKREDPEWGNVTSGTVSRETLAVFLQPNDDEVVSATGETFGQFGDRVLGRHYEAVA